jgi:hypothetical protein
MIAILLEDRGPERGGRREADDNIEHVELPGLRAECVRIISQLREPINTKGLVFNGEVYVPML